MSPWEHETGIRAGNRQRRQEEKGRNDSLVRRAEVEFQADFAKDLSWDVNTAREVLRLPKKVSVGEMSVGRYTDYVTF